MPGERVATGPGPPTEPYLVMRRLALLLVLLLSTLLGVTPVSAQSEPRLLAPPAAPVTSGAFPLLGAPATSGSAAAPGRVRTGVTELSGPSAAEPEPPNVSDPDGEVGAPGDTKTRSNRRRTCSSPWAPAAA